VKLENQPVIWVAWVQPSVFKSNQVDCPLTTNFVVEVKDVSRHGMEITVVLANQNVSGESLDRRERVCCLHFEI